MKAAQDVDIEELILDHPEIKKKKVGKYAVKIRNGDYINPIEVDFCVHNRRLFLSDGHHRAAAYYFLGQRIVKANIESCLDNNCDGNYENIKLYSIRDIILK